MGDAPYNSKCTLGYWKKQNGKEYHHQPRKSATSARDVSTGFCEILRKAAFCKSSTNACKMIKQDAFAAVPSRRAVRVDGFWPARGGARVG